MKEKTSNKLPKNCIIINDKIYTLTEAEGFFCSQCALEKLCDQFIEYPLCECLHGASKTQIYKEIKL